MSEQQRFGIIIVLPICLSVCLSIYLSASQVFCWFFFFFLTNTIMMNKKFWNWFQWKWRQLQYILKKIFVVVRV